jgi:hypothetical protein
LGDALGDAAGDALTLVFGRPGPKPSPTQKMRMYNTDQDKQI